MTFHIVDISKYQMERVDPLNLAQAKAAGIHAVNIALDRGRSEDVLSPWAPTLAAEARRLGIHVMAYRWLDNRLPGAESARRAYDRIVALGGPDGMAHAVDCEDNASEQQLRDYVTTMTALLGRPIVIYTGRWWAQPRGWNLTSLSPYLWAAPNSGYLDAYPGDLSPHWNAGYGGHATLSVMQYAVQPLPGPGDCSLSAIRDPDVWTALTAKGDHPVTYAPATYKEAQTFICKMTGLPAVSVGLVGDAAHGTSGYHLGWDRVRLGKGLQDYSYRESPRDKNFVTSGSSAIDIGWFSINLAGRTVTLLDFNTWLVAQCAAGKPDTQWIREVIYTPDRTTVRRWDRLGVRTTGDGSHTSHTHISGFRDAENTAKKPLFERFFTEMASGTTTQGDGDMDANQANQLRNVYEADWKGGTGMGPAVPDNHKLNSTSLGNSHAEVAQYTRALAEQTAKDVAALASRPAVDPAAVASAMVADVSFITTLAAAVSAQVATLLNQQAGATPDQVRQIVDAELDEAFGGAADHD